jgi:diaminohydroxyphosphoribosylaminopyrimidine deaminase/5-amino-6-(5-phosphoribosylamino)uracil reductase
MERAFCLAERGLYTTQPNPRVGCVIVQDGEVIGEGWHERAGEAHAEVHALRIAGARARGATAYVTLEPCAHYGRTPPCAQALIDSGLARIVVATEDPFPRVAGRGIGMLREAGITVQLGLLREQARQLNIGFFSRIERGRPWTRVKLAMSLDGRTALANGRSTWITGEESRADVQRWRARSSAILTGSGTVLADNPHLTVRLPDGETFAPPLRVVLDRNLCIPAWANVLDGSAPTLRLHHPGATSKACEQSAVGVQCLEVATRAERLDLHEVLHLLAARGCNELLVEAGPTLCGALFVAGLVDELLLYIAPVLLGDAARPLLHLPPLQEMAQRWELQALDQRAMARDYRLLLRPAG